MARWVWLMEVQVDACVGRKTNQLILVKEGDEMVRDQLVEALLKAADLLANGLCHPHLRHQLNVLILKAIIPYQVQMWL